MTYEKAMELLEEGKRSSIYRKAWHKVDSSACLSWATDSSGQPFLYFCACGDWLYKEGGWGGTQEDRDATDWAGTMPEKVTSKREAIQRAVGEGIRSPALGVEWIKEKFGLEVSRQFFASVRNMLERPLPETEIKTYDEWRSKMLEAKKRAQESRRKSRKTPE